MSNGSELLRHLIATGAITQADVQAILTGVPAEGCPTHSEFLPEVRRACRPTTWTTYRAGFDRLVAAFADRPLAAVRTGDLEILMTEVQVEVATRLGGTGAGAAQNLTDAARFFYRHAIAQGLIQTNPAAALRPPPRNRRLRRPLESWEMAEIAHAAATYSRDPELDLLLLQFHRETAARQGGAIGLRLRDIRLDRPSVVLLEKGNHEREVPASRDLLIRLIRHAEDRGATTQDDRVFRRARHEPITRRKYNGLFLPPRRHLAWADRLKVSIHWYRHTTLTDICLATNSRVAAAYAGHVERSVTDIYTHVGFSDLLAAHERVFRATAAHRSHLAEAVAPTGDLAASSHHS